MKHFQFGACQVTSECWSNRAVSVIGRGDCGFNLDQAPLTEECLYSSPIDFLCKLKVVVTTVLFAPTCEATELAAHISEREVFYLS